VNAIKIFQSLEPQKLYNLLVLFVTGLLFWTGLTTLLPTLPAYVEDIGGTTQQVGLVMGGFAIGLLLSRTWLGQLADRKSRKLVVLIGTLVGGIAPLGYIFVHSIYWLITIRAFHGISVAAFTTGYSTLIVDLSPLKQRGELIGYMSLVVPIGMAIGPALGGYLQFSMGYTPLFLISAGLGLLGFFLAGRITGDNRQAILSQEIETEIVPRRSKSFGEILLAPSFLVLTIIMLAIGLLFGTIASFLPLFIREIKLDLNAGLFYTAAAIASFTVRIFVGKASDRYGRGLFITISLICYSTSMLLLTIANTPTVFLIAAVLEGAGGGVLIPMTIALLSDRSYDSERGKVYSICLGGFDVGIAIAGPILGAIAQTRGYREMFFISAILALLSLLLFVTQSNKSLSNSFSFALGKAKDLYALEDREIVK
jgi:MFS family permease